MHCVIGGPTIRRDCPSVRGDRTCVIASQLRETTIADHHRPRVLIRPTLPARPPLAAGKISKRMELRDATTGLFNRTAFTVARVHKREAYRMMRRIVAASVLAAGLVCVSALPAWAHVTIAPNTADKGATDVEIAFRVPNEEATNTTKVQIAFPTDTPLLGVLAQPVPGWTAKVTSVHLKNPIVTDDGTVTDAVSEVDWTANTTADGIAPTQYQRFQVIVGKLPANASALTFKALQTYAHGDVVRWIETGSTATHPAPVLELTTPGSTATPTTQPASTPTTTPTVTASNVKKSDVDSARTFGIIGIVVGALGLLAGGAALAMRRKAQP